MTPRIILADDHTLVREGIRGLLEARMPEAEIVAGTETGRETLEACAKHQPDLLVLDISMPDLGGLEVLERLGEVSPRTKVLMLSQYGDRAYVMRALRLGAKGYLPKKAAAKDLVTAIKTVMGGSTYLDPSVAALVVEAAVHPGDSDESPELERLTQREREVLKLTAEGKTAREVARTLGISYHTANRHRANLMEKLDLHSKADVVKLAVRLQLVEL
jgi:DNA-binding NarL/FixJ family response regulator